MALLTWLWYNKDMHTIETEKQDIGTSVIRLITLRWVAVFGQLLVEAIALFLLDIEFSVVPTVLLTLFLIINNTVLYWWYRAYKRTRISSLGAFAILLSDLLQIASIIFLNGGFNNPFISVMVAPVAVSASIFSIRYTSIITGVAVLLSIMILFAQIHIFDMANYGMYSIYGIPMPDLYVVGLAAAQLATLVFISFYVLYINYEKRTVANALSRVHRAYDKERELSLMGALAAATAHEFGTPLNTIMLIANDLKSQVKDKSLHPDIDELIEQTNRCASILSQLGSNMQDAKSIHEEHFVLNLLETIVAKQVPENITVNINARDTIGDEPVFYRSPEIENGIGNILKNAGQFAKSTIDINVTWNAKNVSIEIIDDGTGFDKHIIRNMGTPFVSTRRGQQNHMGLGLFIAQNLLERTHARMHIGNIKSGGAFVSLIWNRHKIDECLKKQQGVIHE